MRFDDIISKIGHLPAIENEKCKILYDFVLDKAPQNILEIGFFHGKSTLVMAAALDELKSGRILTIDVLHAHNYKPNIIELSRNTQLGAFIEPIFSELGSQWELRRIIKENTMNDRCCPQYEFCFIDAYHSWEKAGLDFFLCDKMLKPGGWMLFDDIGWSFGESPTWQQLPETKAMPEDYRTAKQVGEVFELLVRQHPSYRKFNVIDNWGWAQKKYEVLSDNG